MMNGISVCEVIMVLCVIFSGYIAIQHSKDEKRSFRRLCHIASGIIFTAMALIESQSWLSDHAIFACLIIGAIVIYLLNIGYVTICGGNIEYKKIIPTLLTIVFIGVGVQILMTNVVGPKLLTPKLPTSVCGGVIHSVTNFFSPFYCAEENGFSVYVERNLLCDFNEEDLNVVKMRLADLARAYSNDKSDARLKNLYVGGRLAKQAGKYLLISPSGEIKLKRGMVLPSRGIHAITQPGLGFIDPSNITLSIDGDTLSIYSWGDVDITVDGNGDVEYSELDWNV